MIRIAVILGSTRPNRVGEGVAKWVFDVAQKREDAEFEFVDVKDLNLPLLDEPIPPSQHQYAKPHTLDWAKKVASFDAFLFVTAEYNHGIPAALKNAIDFLYEEWNNKVAGFVSYGSAGGSRSVEQLRLVMAEMQIATVREQVLLYLADDFENYSKFKPNERHEKQLNVVIDQVVAWGTALQPLHAPAVAHEDDEGRDVVAPH
jgi:NAD(P)H-dependent FMN reductase